MFFWIDYFFIFLVIALTGALFWYRRKLKQASGNSKFVNLFPKLLNWTWFLSIIGIIGVNIYLSYLQYQAFQDSELSKFLLPPYQGIGYFVSYVFARFFAQWVVAAAVSLLVSMVARFLNKKFGERFFEKEEIALIGLGVFLSGYPGFFFYLGIIMIFGVLASLIYTILKKGRLPLYHFWLPASAFAMIIKVWLIPALGLQALLGQFSLGDFTKLFFDL